MDFTAAGNPRACKHKCSCVNINVNIVLSMHSHSQQRLYPGNLEYSFAPVLPKQKEVCLKAYILTMLGLDGPDSPLILVEVKKPTPFKLVPECKQKTKHSK